MGLSTIAGWLIGGFACRLYAGAAAVMVASEAVKPLQAVAQAFARLP